MKLSYKLFFDRLVGIPSVYVLNVLAKFLGFLLKPDHSFSAHPETIVISKFLGMGSIIQTTPLLQTLRASYPTAKIVFITSEKNRNLLRMLPMVDEIICIKDDGFIPLLASTFSALLRLWKLRPKVYADLEVYSYFSTIIATLSCSLNRIGYYRKDSHLRMGIYSHMMFFNTSVPVSEVYMQIARLMGCQSIVSNLYPLKASEISHNSLLNKLKNNPAFSPEKKSVIINVNASDLRLERRWRKENFSAVIKKSADDLSQYNLVLIGSADEKEYVKSVIDLLPVDTQKTITDTSGLLNLEELISLIGSAAAVLTNDTGPMHIAFSCGVKTLALFGPCSPGHYGNHLSSIAVYKNLYCSPCVHEFRIAPCFGNNMCMKAISVDEVFYSLSTMLTNTKRDIAEISEKVLYAYPAGSTVLGEVKRK